MPPTVTLAASVNALQAIGPSVGLQAGQLSPTEDLSSGCWLVQVEIQRVDSSTASSFVCLWLLWERGNAGAMVRSDVQPFRHCQCLEERRAQASWVRTKFTNRGDSCGQGRRCQGPVSERVGKCKQAIADRGGGACFQASDGRCQSQSPSPSPPASAPAPSRQVQGATGPGAVQEQPRSSWGRGRGPGAGAGGRGRAIIVNGWLLA
ncbi:hypothetical protein B0T10DRAFT_45610 [Thelonectria olida]|uniref:Uncharacterized protein n=1 Tax=Thelonectria olida TaxID=1576542 RepID=A0A9P9APS6_9HYPO|nr:hypothetical protein B0T10DRAFT_45610 [Thelonectria olida]